MPKEKLIESTRKLEKRLGNQNMNKAINFINNEAFEEWIEVLLKYYDKQYAYGNSLRNKHDIHIFKINDRETHKNADSILKQYDQYINKTERSTVNTI